MAYRPPGRSNRSGRVNAENDVFEGLPVRQWDHLPTNVSLAPSQPVNPETRVADRWADPPMPRDHQLLHPWTQQLLRIARNGKSVTKRRQDHDPSHDDDRPDDENGAAADEEATRNSIENRGYHVRRWKPVPEAHLEPEHKHLEYLAKRRKGLQNSHGPNGQGDTAVPMRKTHVQHAGADGEVAVYAVLVPVGQTIEGEVPPDVSGVADLKPVQTAPGTTIKGVGVANDEGVLVAEHLKRNPNPRRNRPPPKRKAGPGRGKKRVTFTNADGSTYTKIVPNATKIVPKPGQIIKHVAKGEEATADVSAEQAAANAAAEDGTHHGEATEGEEGEEGDDDGEDDGEDEDDDDREDGEITDEEPQTETATPVPSESKATPVAIVKTEGEPQLSGTNNARSVLHPSSPPPVERNEEPFRSVNPSSSSDQLLPKNEDSRQPSLTPGAGASLDITVDSAAPALSKNLPSVEPAANSLTPTAATQLPEPMEVDNVQPDDAAQPEPQSLDPLAALQQSLGFSSNESPDKSPASPNSNDMKVSVENETSLPDPPAPEQVTVASHLTLPGDVELKAEGVRHEDLELRDVVENTDFEKPNPATDEMMTETVELHETGEDTGLACEVAAQDGNHAASLANESFIPDNPVQEDNTMENQQLLLNESVSTPPPNTHDGMEASHMIKDDEKIVTQLPADEEESETYSPRLENEPA